MVPGQLQGNSDPLAQRGPGESLLSAPTTPAPTRTSTRSSRPGPALTPAGPSSPRPAPARASVSRAAGALGGQPDPWETGLRAALTGRAAPGVAGAAGRARRHSRSLLGRRASSLPRPPRTRPRRPAAPPRAALPSRGRGRGPPRDTGPAIKGPALFRGRPPPAAGPAPPLVWGAARWPVPLSPPWTASARGGDLARLCPGWRDRGPGGEGRPRHRSPPPGWGPLGIPWGRAGRRMRDGRETRNPRKGLTHIAALMKNRAKKENEDTFTEARGTCNHTDNFIPPRRSYTPHCNCILDIVLLEGTIRAGFLEEMAEQSGAQDPLIIFPRDQGSRLLTQTSPRVCQQLL